MWAAVWGEELAIPPIMRRRRREEEHGQLIAFMEEAWEEQHSLEVDMPCYLPSVMVPRGGGGGGGRLSNMISLVYMYNSLDRYLMYGEEESQHSWDGGVAMYGGPQLMEEHGRQPHVSQPVAN